MGTNFFRRSVAFGLGAVLAFAVLESGLALYGRLHPPVRPAPVTPGGFTILCLGNSYTAGAGASTGHSYCDRLRERILEEPGLTSAGVKVVNLGVVGMNSAEILEQLERNIHRYHPRLALLMTGEPNAWNLEGYGRYLEKTGRLHGLGGAPVWRSIMDHLQRLRSFRFLALTFDVWKREENGDKPRSLMFPDVPRADARVLGYKWLGLFYPHGDFLGLDDLTEAQAKEALASLIHLDLLTGESQWTISLAIARLYQHRFRDDDAAAGWYEKCLHVDPSRFHYDAYQDLLVLEHTPEGKVRDGFARLRNLAERVPGFPRVYREAREFFSRPIDDSRPPQDRIRRIEAVLAVSPADTFLLRELFERQLGLGNYPAALAALERGLRLNPFGFSGGILSSFSRLRNVEAKAGDKAALAALDDALARFRADFASQTDFRFVSLRDAELSGWIRHDITEIAETLRRNGAEVLLQTYPPRREGSPRIENRVMRSLAAERLYPMSDTAAYFEELFAKTHERDRFYSNFGGPKDEHLNDEGYRLLGDYLFESLRKLNLLPKPGAAAASASFEGREMNGAVVYRNIAYAKPPVGELRWHDPVPEDAPRQARESYACPQPPSSFLSDPPLEQSEDCLYLNVWAPKTGTEHPVIFFVHGGGLRSGSGLDRAFDGSVFARRGVVFVSINYRLGELGYGPKLSPTPGSLGLLDQAAALRWVAANIRAFGGDPERIFLMGQSKGAEAVSALIETGLAGDYVRGVIAMSFAQHFPPDFNRSRPGGPPQFAPGEETEPWERLTDPESAKIFYPMVPPQRRPAGTAHRVPLLATVLEDERFASDRPADFVCLTEKALEAYPDSIVPYFLVWHAGNPVHGAEISSLFTLDSFGKREREVLLQFVETGEPPNELLFRRPRTFRETREAIHVYPWLTTFSAAKDCPRPPAP